MSLPNIPSVGPPAIPSASSILDSLNPFANRTVNNQASGTGKDYAINDKIFNNSRDLVNLLAPSHQSQFDPLDFSRIYGYNLTIYGGDSVSVFNFPIPPQNISISVPSATDTTVTMKGIVEDHNGAPLRRIAIRGTTGVLPLDPMTSTSQTTGPNNLLQAMFKDTFQSAVRVVNQATQLVETVKSIFGGGNISAPLNWKNADISKSTTGYAIAHTMYRFLDGYLAMKKSHHNSRVRLCFEMHKDKMYYDCTLNDFSINKMQGSLEYEYTINLTAWRRQAVPPSGATNKWAKATILNTTPAKDLNAIAGITKALRQSRKLLASSFGIMSGIRGDVDTVFTQPLREAILLGGEASGGYNSLGDFPKSLVLSNQYGLKSAMDAAKDQSKMASISQLLIKKGYFSNDNNKPNYANFAPSQSILASESREAKDSNQAELNGYDNDGSSFLSALNDPEVSIEMLDAFTVDEIPMSDAQQKAISDEIERVQNLTVGDWRLRRDQMESFAASISEAFGGGNATYNRIYGRQNKKVNKKLRTEDILLLAQINDVILAMNSFINAFDESTSTGQNDYYSYYANLARENGIAFSTNQSKFYVPFPYGASMESLAVQYLGQSSRWLEIAALNGLKAPYIDEDGFDKYFKSTGSANSITLNNSENLYIGQTVLLSSDIQVGSPRKITGIDNVSEIAAIITVDGDSNLSDFKSSENAKLKAYMPDTVNSLKMVAIPSASGTGINNRIKVTPTPADLDPIALVAQTDFLLQSDGDLAISSSGEVSLATGLTNIIQAANIKILTRAGSIISDPQFGNPLAAGDSTADTTAASLLSRLSDLFADDPRFGPVLAASVNKKGVACEISILIRVAGTDLNLPIVAELPL